MKKLKRKDEWWAERQKRVKKAKAKEAAERARMEKKHGLADQPKEALDRLWNYAWEEGHSAGFSEVAIHYADMAEVVKGFLSARGGWPVCPDCGTPLESAGDCSNC